MPIKNKFYYNLKNDLYLSDEDIAEMVLAGSSCCIDICDIKESNIIDLLYAKTNILKDADGNTAPFCYNITKNNHGLAVSVQWIGQGEKYVTPVVDIGFFESGRDVWWILKGDVYVRG